MFDETPEGPQQMGHISWKEFRREVKYLNEEWEEANAGSF